MDPVRLGIIGCGNISDAYILGAANSQLVRIAGCADLRSAAAEAKAQQYGIAAVSVGQLLADPTVEVVLNLTNPSAHAAVGMEILRAGKHLYSEKPLATALADARALTDAAATAGLRIGCAPDTFLGGAHQACRRLIDEGRIGRVVAGSAAMLSHGMEHWHPDPGFYFARGGGPLLDMGPYYVTELVNLLGPVRSVAALATQGQPTRTVTSEALCGQIVQVEVSTTVNGLLHFANGANVALTVSWDVWKSERAPLELYGTQGSLLDTDPDWFGGAPKLSERDGAWHEVDISAQPFGAPNWTRNDGQTVANYRAVGVLDMAAALRQGRPHRAHGELALHVLEVLEALERSAAEGRHVAIASTCERPAMLPRGDGEQVLC